MKISPFFYGLFLSLVIIMTSCVSSKKIVYFQTEEDETDPEVTEIINTYKPLIQSGDILSIIVNSISPEAS